jgi:uncharacterized protein YndB with AHSA1/START domain
VWDAWTKPEHMRHWFSPAPWTTVDVEVDLRPGGMLRFLKDYPSLGCFLEVVPKERLVWTDALLPGYRPSAEPFMTAIITMESRGAGTHYVAMARHKDEATRKKHEEMGFHSGWGQTLDQLVEYMKTQKR